MFFQGWPALTAQNRAGAISCAPNLTDEQIEKLKEIRKLYAEELEELNRQFRAEELTEAQYKRIKHALLTALQQEFFELLTDEQKARWRRCMAMEQDIIEDSNSRAFQVMVRVLQLNREQHSELVSLQLRLRNRYRELIIEFRAGLIDREEFVEELWLLRDKRDERLREILDIRKVVNKGVPELPVYLFLSGPLKLLLCFSRHAGRGPCRFPHNSDIGILDFRNLEDSVPDILGDHRAGWTAR
jgi:hypothetical protein